MSCGTRTRLNPGALRILDAVAPSAPSAGSTSTDPPTSYANAAVPPAPAALSAATTYEDTQSAATALVEAQTDIQSAVNAHAFSMRVYGLASRAFHVERGLVTSSTVAMRSSTSWLHTGSSTICRTLLWTVTNAQPTMVIHTAAGRLHARAVGVPLIQLLFKDKCECYEVPNVVVLDTCASVLYSTRVITFS
jgi:hypothetical protein